MVGKDASNKPKDALIFAKYKSEGRKIVALTAYDYRTAQLLDQAGIDLILVGDSLANVVLGLDNTYEIGMHEMVHHTKAVARGVRQAFLATDMPFLSYHLSVEQAVKNAAELMKAGAKAVKLEGATELTLEIIGTLKQIGIPAIGHLGYTPQSAAVLGKGKIQGKTEEGAHRILSDAQALEKVGAVALVLEMVPAQLSKEITQSLKIPTIGIGAGPNCDGQVLVIDDVLGRSSFDLKMAKKYADQAQETLRAAQTYAQEVRAGVFPSTDHSF